MSPRWSLASMAGHAMSTASTARRTRAAGSCASPVSSVMTWAMEPFRSPLTAMKTSGPPTAALALVCRAKGYRCRIVMADCFTEERFQLIRALGGEVEETRSIYGRPKVTAEDIRVMVARAAELAAERGHYGTDQFTNPYIIPGHRDRLGREIWDQTEGRVTAFCQGMGTGGSEMGVSEALRPHGVF